ncbi:HAD family hydrolase [Caldivirga sp.]|uniref:HAD family hydrolase n=1 Tax=Caldivirga sp. TaxID=2080243 RepID=UPI003D10713A
MVNILLAVDYHRTLADESEVGFNVSERVIDSILRFLNSGNAFAVVTSGAIRHVKGLDALKGRLFMALENGLIVITPSGSRVINVPVDWWQLRNTIRNALVNMGVEFSEGEASLFIKYDPVVINALRTYGVRIEVNRGMVSIMPNGIDKGYAINALKRIVKPSAVIAMGDAENDVPMLKAADIAIAVNNAIPEVKSIAHYVTMGNDGDGVIEVINKLLNCDHELIKCITG